MSDAVVARLALAVSLAVACWQVLRYLLEGGRVRVRLSPGLLTEWQLGTADTWRSLERATAKEGGWPVEVAVVDIENLGRQAVTIAEISLDFRSPPWWRPRPKRTVCPRALPAPDASTARRVRLEPFDTVRCVYDIWGVLGSAVSKEPLPRPSRIRAAARIAGKRRLRRSPWRQGWRAVNGQVAFVPGPVEIGLATYRSLWRWTHDNEGMRTIAIPVALAVRKEFPPGGTAPTKEQLQKIIEQEWLFPDKPIGVGLLALYMSRELPPFWDGGAPESSERNPVVD
jgi:hypothetical protein